MSENASADGPVVVGVGLTEESSYVLQKVKGLVGDRRPIIAVHVIERPMIYSTDADQSLVLGRVLARTGEEARVKLDALCEAQGIAERFVIEGNPAVILHQFADERHARVIAIGSHGLHGWRLALGETANSVLHGANCDVVAINTEAHTTEPSLKYDKILIAIDMTNESRAVIETGKRIAEQYGAETELMTAIKPFKHAYPGLDLTAVVDQTIAFENQAEQQYKEQLASLASDYGIEKSEVRHGGAPEQIHEMVKDEGFDLVVMGSHGRHGIQLMFGSTPNAVLHGLTCDLFAVRL